MTKKHKTEKEKKKKKKKKKDHKAETAKLQEQIRKLKRQLKQSSSSGSEDESEKKRPRIDQPQAHIVLMVTGVPYTATEEEVRVFFADQRLAIPEGGVRLPLDLEGRPSGTAFVAFTSGHQFALQLTGRYMGQRFVQVKVSPNQQVFQRSQAAPAATGMPSGSGSEAADSSPLTPSGSAILQVTGLPPAATQAQAKAQVISFLRCNAAVEVGLGDIRLLGHGAAAVKVGGNVRGVLALDRRHVDKSGGCFVEVTLAPDQSMQFPDEDEDTDPTVDPSAPEAGGVVKMSGFPWGTTDEDIRKFFHQRCAQLHVPPDGVHQIPDEDGRPSGMAFVEMFGGLHHALGLSKQYMGSRYVQIFSSSVEAMAAGMQQAQAAAERFKQKQEGGGGQVSNLGMVTLSGLPFDAEVADIQGFFRGHALKEGGIWLDREDDGRRTGKAFVEFVTVQAAEEAMFLNHHSLGGHTVEIKVASEVDIRSARSQIRLALLQAKATIN